jgi:hypothetical protein
MDTFAKYINMKNLEEAAMSGIVSKIDLIRLEQGILKIQAGILPEIMANTSITSLDNKHIFLYKMKLDGTLQFFNVQSANGLFMKYKPVTSLCSNCHKSCVYRKTCSACSRKCQLEDWPKHKKWCGSAKSAPVVQAKNVEMSFPELSKTKKDFIKKNKKALDEVYFSNNSSSSQ